MKDVRTHFTSISVRMTPQERERVEELAGNQTISAYVRDRLLGDEAEKRKCTPRKIRPDHDILAQLLCQLGASRMASNLNQIAKAINMDAVILSPQQQEIVIEAAHAVIEMRDALMQALGLRR